MRALIFTATDGGIPPIIVPLFVTLVFLLFLIWIVKERSKNTKRMKAEHEGAICYAMLKHINGLPIAENVLCDVVAFPNKYEFRANGTVFELERSKITDVSVISDTEIQKQYVSSVGGAIGGAVLFGALGAMIGGRAKEKTSTTTQHYLIFTYLNNDEVKYTGFDCTIQIGFGKTLADEFKKNKPAENNIKVSL